MSAAAPSLTPPRADLRTLLSLAWPVVLARSSQSVVGLADALMVAPLGEAALAATTTGALNTFAFIILPMGTVFIVQSFAAQLFGRGDLIAARRYAWYGLILAAVAMVVSVLMTPLIGPVLGLFHFAPVVHRLQTDYMIVRVWSLGAVVGTEALGNWFGGLGNTKLQMRASLITMVGNVVLNWVLIYGKLGLPAMGVTGAALASTLASGLGFAYLAWAFGRREREPDLRGPLRLRLSELGRMVRFGLPSGFNWFMEFAAFMLFINAVVAPLGTIPLAAINVIMTINSVSFMPAFGLASAGAILVGQAIGRGDKDGVSAIVWRTARVTMTWQTAVGLLYLLTPVPLLLAFIPPGDAARELLRVGAIMLAISGVWQAFDSLCLTFGEALRGAGDTAWCMWARLIVAWLVFMPVAYVAVSVWRGGPVAAMWSIVIYIVCLAGTLVWRFQSGAWRRIQLTEPEVVV